MWFNKKHGKSDRDQELMNLAEEIADPVTKDYVKIRLLDQAGWYGRKSRRYKKEYLSLSVFAMIFSAIISVLSVVADFSVAIRVLIAVFGGTVTVINGYLTVASIKNSWLTYRDTRESLISLFYQYRGGFGIFAAVTDQTERDQLLMKTSEAILTSEVKGWIKFQLEEK